jgi:hypothetical protein
MRRHERRLTPSFEVHETYQLGLVVAVPPFSLPNTMHTYVLVLLAASVAAASNIQVPFLRQEEYGPDMPVPSGFDLDLHSKRLVQFADSKEPVRH